MRPELATAPEIRWGLGVALADRTRKLALPLENIVLLGT